jgi:hypothetical protein
MEQGPINQQVYMARLDSPRLRCNDRPKTGANMDFHDFPTIRGVLKRNALIEEPRDRLYAGALGLLWLKAWRDPIGLRQLSNKTG